MPFKTVKRRKRDTVTPVYCRQDYALLGKVLPSLDLYYRWIKKLFHYFQVAY